MAYQKQTFTEGQTLTAKNMNHIEAGIESADTTANEALNKHALKQDKLVSGTNIKTVNGQSLLGGGDIPTQTNNTLKGKIVSVLGDSISAMQGYIPVDDGWNKKHDHQYATSFGVDNMWWKIVIDRLGAKLGICDAWDGTTVRNTATEDSGKSGPNTYIGSSTRLINLASNGTPDVILVFAGTNDTRRASATSLGTFDNTQDYAPMTDEELYTNTTESVLASSFTALIRKLQYLYPNAKIACITPMYGIAFSLKPSGRAMALKVIRDICDYFGVLFIDATKAGLNINNTYSGVYTYFKDTIHPNKDGMKLIGDYVYKQVVNAFESPVGESIVYKVTNTLEYLTTSKPQVVGVKKGESYKATLSGTTDFTGVTVYMGTTNITSSALANGVITIPSVTGDIVIADSAIEPPTEITYNVTFEENGGSAVSDLNGVTTLPDPLPTTTRSGYIFGGWFTNSTLTSSAVAGATITSNVTLYAKWIEEETDEGGDDSGDSNGSVDESAVTWYVDNSSQANKTFNYSKNYGGCAFRNATISAKLRGVPINVVKCYPSSAGLMNFARWIPSTGDIIEVANCTVLDSDVYTTSPANEAEPKLYKLNKILTLSDGEYLLLKYNSTGAKGHAGFWVNAGNGSPYEVYTYASSTGASKEESWGASFGVGYVEG